MAVGVDLVVCLKNVKVVTEQISSNSTDLNCRVEESLEVGKGDRRK